MQLSHISLTPYRADVRRVSIHRINNVDGFGTRTAQSAVSLKSVAPNSQVSPKFGNAFNYSNRELRALGKSKRALSHHRICVIILMAGIIAAILASITGIVLALTLRQTKSVNVTTITVTTATTSTSTTSTTSETTTTSTTTSTTSKTTQTVLTTTSVTTVSTTGSTITSSTTTTTDSTSTTTSTSSTTSTTTTTLTTTSATTTRCSSRSRGNLGVLTGYASSSWTQYSATYTAISTEHVLIFGFQAAVNRSWIIDNVSAVDTTAPSIELLSNPSFENSTTSISSWVNWCSSHCQFGTSGQIVSGADCYLGTGNCFVSSCLGGGIEFLGQYFPTTPGSVYNISFMASLTGSGGYYYTMLYVDIF
ncbi:unnamed protein product [Rotaria magnacalcarata]|uniref:Uncharacterized protein n=4 Tax=Rotaria magnacalcarata TaxID=392030 RepID=A0A816PVK5_9BILA|nr:unnamed protein product [Rotaria magnacalcarata]CAF4231047.1 unnamed protein product [Rotaria magnacalcarata]